MLPSMAGLAPLFFDSIELPRAIHTPNSEKPIAPGNDYRCLDFVAAMRKPIPGRDHGPAEHRSTPVRKISTGIVRFACGLNQVHGRATDAAVARPVCHGGMAIPCIAAGDNHALVVRVCAGRKAIATNTVACLLGTTLLVRSRSHCHGVIHLDGEVSDGAIRLHTTQRPWHRSQIRAPVGEHRRRSGSHSNGPFILLTSNLDQEVVVDRALGTRRRRCRKPKAGQVAPNSPPAPGSGTGAMT